MTYIYTYIYDIWYMYDIYIWYMYDIYIWYMYYIYTYIYIHIYICIHDICIYMIYVWNTYIYWIYVELCRHLCLAVSISPLLKHAHLHDWSFVAGLGAFRETAQECLCRQWCVAAPNPRVFHAGSLISRCRWTSHLWFVFQICFTSHP